MLDELKRSSQYVANPLQVDRAMSGRALAMVVLFFSLVGVAQARRDDDTVECRSRDYQQAECGADFRHPVLLQQISDSACVEGQTWGYSRRRGTIWVTNGCAGVFGEGDDDRRRRDDDEDRYRRDEDDRDRRDDRYERHHGHREEVVECRSTGYAFTRCGVNWREARLLEQLSNSDCEQGRTWGIDDDGLWVDRGCAGRFAGH